MASGNLKPVLALHGFLGCANDWGLIAGAESWQAPDLWQWSDLSFAACCEELLKRLPKNEKPVLVGYSMGGRLAMHLAITAPERFSAAVFISANPGLQDENARVKRLLADKTWASRFLSEPWSALISDWNAQAVLQTPLESSGSLKLERHEADFDRHSLSQAMSNWSLGQQRNLRSALESLSLPTLYLSGAADTKFSELMRELKLTPRQRHEVVSGAGHRLPWDQPGEFVSRFERFLNDTL